MKLTVNSKEYDVKRVSSSLFVNEDSNAVETVDITLTTSVDDIVALKNEIEPFDGSFSVTKDNGDTRKFAGYGLTNIRSQIDANSDDTTIQFTAK